MEPPKKKGGFAVRRPVAVVGAVAGASWSSCGSSARRRRAPTDPEGAREGAFPVFLEMGLGVDLVGEDATKAARRAAREAMGRTSLPGLRDLIPSGDRADMRVEVTVAVPGHEAWTGTPSRRSSPTAA